MVKKIKTVKQLKKHIGETLHVVSREGYEFDATVEKTGKSADSWLVLKTTDKEANKDHSWWPLGGKVCHNCAYDYQISEELESLTTIDSKAEDKAERILTKSELDAARGHFCLLKDGSKGFICVKIAADEKPTRILHNSSDSRSWEYKEREMSEDNAPEAIKHDFTRAYNIWNDEDSLGVRVVKVLEKYDGRKYRYKKVKKTVTEEKKDTKFLSAHEIRKGIGHLCKLADGQEAFIASNEGDASVVCMSSRSNGYGWSLDASDVAAKFRDSIKDYKYGWGILDNCDAAHIKVVEILDEPKAVEEPTKTAESPKTILDMTIKEVLEKLDEIIKR